MVVHNLPTQSTPFVGRTEELAEIVGLLENPTCRLLTLVGLGGMGKTRLALEAAKVLNADDAEPIDGASSRARVPFPNGVYFVPLQPLTSPDFILSALAEAVGVQFYPGSEPWPQLIDYLRSKAALLILDNLEHLLDGVALFSDMLANAPKIKVLATSRETLGLQEEWLYPLRRMPFPDSEREGDLENYDAVQLFVQNARRVRPDFSLAAEKGAVVRICKLVEGLPLALEMTAAWLRRLPCHEIVPQIELGLDILESPVRNVPPRHRSIRAVFEHSCRLLTEPERDVFKKLSVFRGGFRQEAAEVITGASLAVLSALVDKSLLRVDGTGRYDLHELVRQYAEEQLDQSPETSQETLERHATHYAGILSRQEHEIVRGDRGAASMALNEESDNLRRAWKWMVEQGKLENVQEMAWLLIYSVIPWAEGETLLREAVERMYNIDELTLATLLGSRGRCAQFLGRFDSAWRLNQEALSIARKLDFDGLTGNTLFQLSEIARSRGDYAQARQLGEESLAIYSRSWASSEFWKRTFILGNLGEIARLAGDYAGAKRLHEESLAAAQEVGTQFGIADAWNHLGNVYLALGAYNDARRAFQSGLTVGKAIDDRDVYAPASYLRLSGWPKLPGGPGLSKKQESPFVKPWTWP